MSNHIHDDPQKLFSSLNPDSRELGLAVFSTVQSMPKADFGTDNHLRTIETTAAHIIAPTLFFYIWWVLDKARQQGIERLYFLGRDGQILFKIAQIMNTSWGYQRDCRYLYASREAWFFPAIQDIGPFELEWMTSYDPNLNVSVKSVCEHLGIEPVSLHHELFSYGFPEKSWSRDLSPSQLKRIKSFLQKPIVFEKMHHRIEQATQTTLGYLKQEGILDGRTLALVDIGWKGSLQYALSKILAKTGNRPAKGIAGFYFGLDQKTLQYENDRLHVFLINDAYRHLQNNPLYCEVFAASDQNKTNGYTFAENRYHPVLGPSAAQILTWGVKLQQELILQFAQQWTTRFSPDNLKESAVLPLLDCLLYRFLIHPSFAEAEAYGKTPITIAMNEKRLQEFAPKFEFQNRWLPKTYWVPGSCVRSGMPFGRYIWKIFQTHPRFNRILRRIFIALQKLLKLNQFPSSSMAPQPSAIRLFLQKIFEILLDPGAFGAHFMGLLRRTQVKKVFQDGELFFEYRGQRYPAYLNYGNAALYIRDTALTYCKGKGIDIGAGAWPLPGSIAVLNDRDQNAFCLPHFPDAGLDFVFSSHCLEHLKEWQKALRLWISKLKPGGILFLYLPHKEMQLWHRGGPWVGGHHRWQPDVETVGKFLKQNGIEIVDYNPGYDRYYSFHIVGRKGNNGEPK